MQKLNFAIIGCGHIAKRHAEEISKVGNLVAVCDIVEDKAQFLANQYQVTPFYSLEDLLNSSLPIDVISICTPNGLHAQHSIAALTAKKHVLCEKPMALQTVDCLRMMEAADKNECKLFIVKQNRFNPPVQFVKELITANKLGAIQGFQLNCFWNRPTPYYQNSWKGSLALDGGTLFTQFSHFIDLLYYFLGPIEKANGFRQNIAHKDIIEFEDYGTALLTTQSGIQGSFHYTINAFQKNMEGSITLFGEKGTVKIGGQYLNELEYFAVEDVTTPILEKGNAANHYGFYEGSMSNHDKVYQHLVQAINNPSFDFINPFETMKTVEIIELIYQHSPLEIL